MQHPRRLRFNFASRVVLARSEQGGNLEPNIRLVLEVLERLTEASLPGMIVITVQIDIPPASAGAAYSATTYFFMPCRWASSTHSTKAFALPSPLPPHRLAANWRLAFDPREARRCLGVAVALHRKALNWAKVRVQGGKPLIEHEGIRAQLAEMKMLIDASRSYIHRACWLADHQAHGWDRTLGVLPKGDGLGGGVEDRHMMPRDPRRSRRGYVKEFGVEKLVRDAAAFLHFGRLQPDTVSQGRKLHVPAVTYSRSSRSEPMKAMVLKGPNTPFEMIELPDPVAAPGEAVARVISCGSGLTISACESRTNASHVSARDRP